MRALPVLTCREGPSYLRFHPKFTSALLVATSNGRYQLRDTTTGAITDAGIVDTGGSGLGACDISSSGDGRTFLAFDIVFLTCSSDGLWGLKWCHSRLLTN